MFTKLPGTITYKLTCWDDVALSFAVESRAARCTLLGGGQARVVIERAGWTRHREYSSWTVMAWITNQRASVHCLIYNRCDISVNISVNVESAVCGCWWPGTYLAPGHLQQSSYEDKLANIRCYLFCSRHEARSVVYPAHLRWYLGPLLLTWLSNYIHYKVWDEITYPFLNFNGCTFEV